MPDARLMAGENYNLMEESYVPALPLPHSAFRFEPSAIPLCCPSFASGQALPRNWMIFRRSRFDGLPAGNSSNCFIALRSAATFRRSSRLSSVSR